MTRKEHVHKYNRVDAGVHKKYLVYSCADPDCPKVNHYLTPKLVINKKTICWGCEKETVMNSHMATKAKPKCVLCQNENSVSDVLDLVEGILGGKSE